MNILIFIGIWFAIFVVFLLLMPLFMYFWSLIFHVFKKDEKKKRGESGSYSLNQVKEAKDVVK